MISDLLPSKVLVLYRNYTEERAVDGKGNILAGKPLSKDSLQELAADLLDAKEYMLGGIIPSSLVYIKVGITKHRLIFRTEERQQPLMFAGRLPSTMTGHYAIPNLLFVCTEEGLAVYAYKKWEDEKTELFYAPFPNITDHYVCTGVKLPKVVGCPKKYVEAIEAIFWNTSFTHFTNTKVIKGNIEQSYKKMLNAKSFDYSLLIPTKLQFHHLCN